MNRLLDVATSFAVTVARLGAGMGVESVGPRPVKPLELYEFEGCPFCRKVREALSALDLDAVVYPCPKNGPTFRPTSSDAAARRSSRTSSIRTPASHCTSPTTSSAISTRRTARNPACGSWRCPGSAR
jgi:hypothetical protein